MTQSGVRLPNFNVHFSALVTRLNQVSAIPFFLSVKFCQLSLPDDIVRCNGLTNTNQSNPLLGNSCPLMLYRKLLGDGVLAPKLMRGFAGGVVPAAQRFWKVSASQLCVIVRAGEGGGTQTGATAPPSDRATMAPTLYDLA
jgi:hypothetical protein